MNNVIDITDKVDASAIGLEIGEIYDKQDENIYIFNPGLDLEFEFTKQQKIFNSNTFNILCAYKKNIYDLYNQIKSIYIDRCESNNFDYISSKPHIACEVVKKNNYDLKTKYDFGIDSGGEYFGLYVISSNGGVKLNLNDQEIFINEAHIAIFSTRSTIEFIDIPDNFMGIEFYISGLRNLDSQYYGKWIPLL